MRCIIGRDEDPKTIPRVDEAGEEKGTTKQDAIRDTQRQDECVRHLNEYAMVRIGNWQCAQPEPEMEEVGRVRGEGKKVEGKGEERMHAM